jgi:Tol biopolymer transport system component
MARQPAGWPWLIGTALFCIVVCSAAAAQDPGGFELSLQRGWRVKRAGAAGDLVPAALAREFDEAAWDATDIDAEGNPPHDDRVVLYRRWVEVPAAWQGRKTSLAIGLVGDACAVYVNGQKVGEQQGRARFEVDLSAHLRAGERNLLAVLCERSQGAIGMSGEITLSLTEEVAKAKAAREAALRERLKLSAVPWRLLYETYRETNWELCIVKADGSNATLLTHTPDTDELYPKVSPDGTRVCFLADETVDGQRRRNLYLMGLDGSRRTRIADDAREGCWSADGKRIAYLKAEFRKFTLTDYASKGLVIYDVATGNRVEHPNQEIHHLYNLAWTPDGQWFVATVHGGMGFRHAILAFEANGTRVFDLGKWQVGGCRPDLSPDGKRLAWGASDETLMAGDIDFGGPEPRVSGAHPAAHCAKGYETYHVEWSPDGTMIAFSHGLDAGEQLGLRAPGWNICVGDLAGNWVPVTSDGRDNKEPDWVPVSAERK